MTIASAIHRGDVYWVAPDDAQGSYPHPHVVVQEDVFNQSRLPSVIVCALTTHLGRANEPGNVLLAPGEGDLPKQSVVVVSQILAVDKARLGERIGRLSEARVEQILDGLRFLQRSFFARQTAPPGRYEAKAVDYASCRWMERLGAGKPDPEADAVRRLHDAQSGAESDRLIA